MEEQGANGALGYITTLRCVILTLTSALAIAFAWVVIPLVLRIKKSGLWVIPGPRSTSWLLGNLREYNDSPRDLISDEWMERHGSVVRIHGFLQTPMLSITDNRAINHLFTNYTYFTKPEYIRLDLSKLLCEGLLTVEGTSFIALQLDHASDLIAGERYKHQRRILNQVFGMAQIRAATSTFFDKARELRDLWTLEATAGEHSTRIDVLHGLNMASLDAVGQTVFNCDFEALRSGQKPNKFSDTMEQIFSMPNQKHVLVLMKNLFPVLDFIIDPNMKLVNQAVGMMRGIGVQLVAEKKAELLREGRSESNSLEDRDFVSALVKAHIRPDVPGGQCLSEDDVLSQFPTFIIAGHETTSDATAWCLYELAQAPHVQAKLREELRAVETDSPTMDELVSLQYLDMVVREILRLRAPVTSTVRTANKTDVVPLETPFRGLDGEMHDSIQVPEGTIMIIPFMAIHRSKAIWGPDAAEFRPERWENPPKASINVPGVWGHLLSFGGGPRACIGFRFALVEMKALIFTLLRAFEFTPAVDSADISTMPGIVLRPCLKDAPEGGSQLPLLVRRCEIV
ncbi:cytochrome P450 [Cubamyces sp. BRFM 1775]|nr:cytochrome P450 [Cubamyces sp. BRFM 1775]